MARDREGDRERVTGPTRLVTHFSPDYARPQLPPLSLRESEN